ncbi:MAG: metal ABC transporter permease, partial [Anaerolineae bacterium]
LAMFVTPAAAASLLTWRLPALLATGAVIGVTAGVVGMYASYYLDIASGAAVVLAATLIFVVVFIFAPGRGLLAAKR